MGSKRAICSSLTMPLLNHGIVLCQFSLLRGHNWQHFAHRPQCTVTLNSKFAIFKTWKLFSIRVKELNEPIVLWKKRRRVIALFISIFLRNLSLSNARWFYGKKRKIGKGNLYLTENPLSGNEMWCVAKNNNYMCHIMCKRIQTLIKRLLTKYQIFTNCPKFHIFTEIVIF